MCRQRDSHPTLPNRGSPFGLMTIMVAEASKPSRSPKRTVGRLAIGAADTSLSTRPAIQLRRAESSANSDVSLVILYLAMNVGLRELTGRHYSVAPRMAISGFRHQ